MKHTDSSNRIPLSVNKCKIDDKIHRRFLCLPYLALQQNKRMLCETPLHTKNSLDSKYFISGKNKTQGRDVWHQFQVMKSSQLIFKCVHVKLCASRVFGQSTLRFYQLKLHLYSKSHVVHAALTHQHSTSRKKAN